MDIAGQEGFDECSRPDPAPIYTAGLSLCSLDRATQITVDIIVAFAVLYFAVTCVLLLSKPRSYRKLPYTFVQVGLVYNTLQVDCVAAANPARVNSTLVLSLCWLSLYLQLCESNACSLFCQLWWPRKLCNMPRPSLSWYGSSPKAYLLTLHDSVVPCWSKQSHSVHGDSNCEA